MREKKFSFYDNVTTEKFPQFNLSKKLRIGIMFFVQAY